MTPPTKQDKIRFALEQWAEMEGYKYIEAGKCPWKKGTYIRLHGYADAHWHDHNNKFIGPPTIDYPFMHELIRNIEGVDKDGILLKEYFYIELFTVVTHGAFGFREKYEIDELKVCASLDNLLKAYWMAMHG